MSDTKDTANTVIDLVLEGLVTESTEKKQIALENILYEFLEKDREKFERLHEHMQWQTPHDIEDEGETDEE